MPSPSLFSPFRAWWAQLNASQQFSLLILGPCAFIVLGLSIFQLHFRIASPFRVSDVASQRAERLLTPASTTETAAVSPQKDTDGDGLSDADEVNVYHTSPYLKDTDSDGISDGQEVKNGTDPNCPQGKDCLANGLLNAQATDSGTGTNATTTQPAVPPPVLTPPTPPAQMTPEKIRAYLVSNKLMGEADARSFPDEGVVQLYGRIYDQLIGVQASQSVPMGTASSTNATSSSLQSTRSSSAP